MCQTRPGNEWLVCRYWEDQSHDDGDEEDNGDDDGDDGDDSEVDYIEQGDLKI